MTVDLRAAHASLVASLWRLRNGDGGWPYYLGRTSRLEATCWAAVGTGVSLAETPLPNWKRQTGLINESPETAASFAFNGLAAIVACRDATTKRLARDVATALVSSQGVVLPRSPVTRLDTTLVGWSWLEGTFSWAEPTAWCLLAMTHCGQGVAGADSRIASAVALMRDRACSGGGWNFGSNEVLGRPLAAYVPTTAIGVLALQLHRDEPFVEEAVSYLERDALSEQSTMALSLTALALAAVGRPARLVVDTLASNVATTNAVGNAATIGMAAHALDCAIRGVPSIFALTTHR